MKLALVNDSLRTGRRSDAEYITTVLDAVEAMSGITIEMKEFGATPPQQGGAVAGLTLVRAEAPRLKQELADWGPDAVVSMGKMPLNALGDGSLKVLKREHGRMRWLDLPDGSQVPWTPGVAPIFVVKKAGSDLHKDFANVIYKAVTQPAPMPEVPIDLYVASNATDLGFALDLIDSASVVGVDVETGGLSAYSDELTAVGFGAYGEDDAGDPYGIAAIVPKWLLFDPDVIDLMWDATWRSSRRSVGHNFKFDMQFLERLVGWAPDGALIGDTLLLAHLLDERPTRMNARARGSGLKDLVAQRYDLDYGFDFTTPYDALTNEEVNNLHVYLGKDVVYTARLWHDEADEARAEGRLLQVHDELLAPAAKAIAKCELAGAPIDKAWVDDTMAVIERRILRRTESLEKALHKLTLTLVVDNIMSPTQIADVMYDEWQMTPDIRGRRQKPRSTDKDHVDAAVLKYIKGPKYKQARWLRAFVKLRKDVKVLTTYQKSILDKLDDDGRVRASFLLHGTSTGRLSSQGPNLQNVPAVKRTGADVVRPMRRAFAPIPGRVWCDVDYSQLELRVAAAVSGDQALTEVFKSGRDIHMEIATAIFSKDASKISAAERFIAKSVSFGIIYGRTASAIAEGAEMDYAEAQGMVRWTEAQAEAFVRKFLQSYPQLTLWIAEQHKNALIDHYVESPFGRRRRFDLIPDREIGAVQRQAVNTPIQSAASDLCLTSLIEIQKCLEGLDATVLFPVHDSICIECDESLVPTVEEICRMVMEKEWMGVPLTVDFSYGSDWARAGGWKK